MNENEPTAGPPDTENPYAPPTVTPPPRQTGSEPRFIAAGRQVLVGQGVTWLSGGWALFKEAPGMWILFTVILLVASVVMNFIPLGGIALSLVSPVLLGGIMLGCAAIKQGEPLELGHLFAGFSTQAGPLLLVGLLYMVGTIAIMLIILAVVVASIGVSGIGAMLASGNLDPFAGLSGMVLGGLLAALFALALTIPLLMAFWFTAPLVVFHGVEPIAAIRTSFGACLKNIVAFLIYGLIGLVLAVAATIPLMLGWLVLIPVIMASIYAAYRDIFFEA